MAPAKEDLHQRPYHTGGHENADFGRTVAYAEVPAGVRFPIGAIPASAGIEPIGGQAPAEIFHDLSRRDSTFHDPRCCVEEGEGMNPVLGFFSLGVVVSLTFTK